MLNPLVVGELFHEQSAPWRDLTHKHVQRIWCLCKEFMKVALQHVATDNGEAAAAILQNIVEPSMDRILKDAQRKTDDILKSHRNIHPITYNIDILAKINRLAAKKKRAEFEIIRKTFLAVAKSQDTIKHGSLDLMDLVDDLVEGNMNDSPMKTNAGLEESIALYALDVLEAYYDVS